MKPIDILIDTAARDYLKEAYGPFRDCDIVAAFKAGADCMSEVLRIRHPYMWGVKQTLLGLKNGQSVTISNTDARGASNYRTIVSNYTRMGFGYWTTHHDSAKREITITRL